MKTIITLAFAILCTLFVNGKEPETINYIKTKNDVIFGTKVAHGLSYTKCVLANGSILKIKNNDVLSYQNEQGTFDYLQGENLKKDNISEGFKRLIAVKDGFKLYICQTKGFDNKTENIFLIYKKGKYIVSIAENQMENYAKIFKVKLNNEN